MKSIEGCTPAELIQDASTELLIEQKREGVQKVKKLFAAIYDLSTVEIPKLEAELKKKREQLAQKNTILEKLKGGDWSALADEKKPQEQQA